jgi:hypothetical protein
MRPTAGRGCRDAGQHEAVSSTADDICIQIGMQPAPANCVSLSSQFAASTLQDALAAAASCRLRGCIARACQ